MQQSQEKEQNGVRMDRYLWHVRLCKTRSLASQACKSGEVRIEDKKIKPSRLVKLGVEFQLRRGGVTRSYRVIGLVEHRVSAKEVVGLLEETTPQEVLDLLQSVKEAPVLTRERGAGRPTKRDLRLIEKLFS